MIEMITGIDLRQEIFAIKIFAVMPENFKILFEALSQACSAILRLQLHGAIYCPDFVVLMLRYCVNLKAIRYESTSLNRIVADKSHRVIVA